MTRLTTLSGAPVSRFAFGTMQWGGRASVRDAAETYAAARAAGITHFDTAHIYTDGRAEELSGERVAAERDEIYVATKVAYAAPATRATLTEQFDLSRQRLKLDQVDLLYLHRFDAGTPLEETFEVMAEFQQAGLIRHIGVSNYAAWQVMKAQAVCDRLGTRIDAVQPMISLVKRQAEVELLPMCADQGIVPVTYSPLGGGLLTGKYAGGDGSGRLAEDGRYAARYGQDWMAEAAAELARIAAREGTHPATLAVAWLARHAPLVHPILSARTAEQLAPSLDGMIYPLHDAIYREITALSPTPANATDRIEER